MVVYGDLAVIARPGRRRARAETAGAEAGGARRSATAIARIEAPGTLDGGDVLKHGGTSGSAWAAAPTQAGVDQLAATSRRSAPTWSAYRSRKVLHLKSAVTALPDGTVVGFEPLVDDPAVWAGHFLAVPEEPGAHVVVLDGDDRPDGDVSARDRCDFEERGLRRGRRRHLRVREARGLRDLPVGPAARRARVTPPTRQLGRCS